MKSVKEKIQNDIESFHHKTNKNLTNKNFAVYNQH